MVHNENDFRPDGTAVCDEDLTQGYREIDAMSELEFKIRFTSIVLAGIVPVVVLGAIIGIVELIKSI